MIIINNTFLLRFKPNLEGLDDEGTGIIALVGNDTQLFIGEASHLQSKFKGIVSGKSRLYSITVKNTDIFHLKLSGEAD